ncbi:MAG: hypothetical protein AAGE01_20520 [Pseudomonadota bacterium]
MRFTQPIIAGALATVLIACASSPPSGGSSSTGGSPPSGSSTAAATSGDGTPVGTPVYPRVIDTPNGSLVVHMPQIDTWEDYESMTAWVAVEAKTKDADKVWFGSVKIEASTDIEWAERVVVVHDQKVVDSNIIGDETPPEAIRELVLDAIPNAPKAVPLDTVIRALPDDFEPKNYRPGPPTKINFEPPQILVRTTPAALMFIDGEPVKAPIEETGLEFVINTNWDLFWHADSERWYVRNQDAWMITASLEDPDWQLVTSLPEAFNALPDGENWEEVKQALPARSPAAPLPEILIAMKPTEIIVINGEPDLEVIPAAGMSYVANTESDLFRYQDGWYFLTSGRWFTTMDLQGDWTPVEQLPENFAYIPDGHPRGDVLASVPGSDDARAAVIEAQIPRTATISVDAVPDIQVEFAGAPQFTSIEGTSLERAVNTSYQIIKAGDTYYLCHNAVWFLSDAPMGPWTVATEVPSEIYTIPSSDPYHNTTYVYTMPQSEAQSTTSVTYAYGVGYYGSYVGVGVTEQVTENFSVGLYFGTGYYYPPYYGFYPWGYPYYGWYPRSYGYGSWYNPSTGTFGRVGSVYGPYGGARAMSAYNPRTGSYARGWSAWDSDEFYRQGGAYNPRTGTIAAGNMYYDFDENRGWADRYVERGDRWYHGETTYDGNRATTNYETSRGVTGTSNRVREDGQITGSGTIQAGDRTGTTQSRIDREGYDARITGEDGRTVDVSKDWGGDRNTTITNPDGESITGSTSRGPGDTRRTDFETSGGASGTTIRGEDGRTTVGRSENGDLYASRNGNVYRRGDDGGWSNYNNGSWQSVDRGGADRSQARSTLSTRDYGNLDRQYRARNTGTRNYNRYNSHRAAGGYNRGGGARMRGRRR